ncbi:Co-chaperone [Tieghemiomyces parasiticus]|uniref:Co-chaperone n=1 Tax=Tieghemiomyces parasiticus TaxID=78921 RepID=A0A9W8AI15_9FUNG|nr:Co-chaperone [Tieghemiomyces parasiticus]
MTASRKKTSGRRSLDASSPASSTAEVSARSDVITNLAAVDKPFKNPSYKATKKYRSLKQVLALEKNNNPYPVDFPTFWSIEAPPSLLPATKYCDITGYEALYTDPKSNLRYHNVEIYQYIQELPRGTEQQYLELRNAHVVLR